jgi:hypothetical protein
MFSRRTLEKDYAGIIKQIEDGERRAPKHRPPHSIRDSGFNSFVTSAHEIMFEDFRWFGAMMNQNVSEPWSIEELPDTLVRDFTADSPDIGRRYRVHFNSCDLGTLQVTAGGIASLRSAEEFSSHPEARVLVDLDYLRFVPFDDVHSFLSAIGMFVGRFEERDAAVAVASAAATAALTGYLWETVRRPDSVVSFHQQLEGPYDLVRLTTKHWEKSGIDPFAMWSGDRPPQHLP